MASPSRLKLASKIEPNGKLELSVVNKMELPWRKNRALASHDATEKVKIKVCFVHEYAPRDYEVEVTRVISNNEA
jgi:hypothetical protein